MARERSCHLESLSAGEPLWGTAPYTSALLLASWPKSEWKQEALSCPTLPEAIARWPERAGATSAGKPAARLVWRSREPRDAGVRLWRFPGAEQLGPLPAAEVAEALHPSSGSPPWAPCLRPLLIVCTHGKHDACCAEQGQPLVLALARALEAEGLEVDLWESSHLGGHRFAATALSLPSGRMWGRLRPEDAPRLAAHLARDTVWSARYRGSLFSPPPVQIAEGFGWEQLGDAPGRVEAGEAEAHGDRWRVRVRVLPQAEPPSEYDVTSAPAIVFTAKSCDALDAPEPIARFALESAVRVS